MCAVEHIEPAVPEADLHLIGKPGIEALHNAIHTGGVDLALVAVIRLQPCGGHALVFIAALIIAGNATADRYRLRLRSPVCFLNHPFNRRGPEKIPTIGFGRVAASCAIPVLSAHNHISFIRSFRSLSACSLVF